MKRTKKQAVNPRIQLLLTRVSKVKTLTEAFNLCKGADIVEASFVIRKRFKLSEAQFAQAYYNWKTS